MVFESSLANEATQFANALDIRPARAVDKTEAEQTHAVKNPDQHGDTVSISEEARALAAPEESGENGKSMSEDKQERIIQDLKERIQKLEEDIKEAEKSDMPEKQKMQEVSAKLAELMELRDQLVKAEATKAKMAGLSSGGGTRAQGFGQSAEEF